MTSFLFVVKATVFCPIQLKALGLCYVTLDHPWHKLISCNDGYPMYLTTQMQQIFLHVYMQLNVCNFELCYFAKTLFYVCLIYMIKNELQLGIQTCAIQTLNIDKKVLCLNFIFYIMRSDFQKVATISFDMDPTKPPLQPFF